MNVLFLTTHLNTGGISSYLYTLSKAMIKRGSMVFVASSGGNMDKDFADIGVNLFPVDIRTKSELSPKIYLVLGQLKEIIAAHKIDIIHANTRITQVMGRILKSLTNKPYVSTCHGYFKTRWSRSVFPCWGDRVIAISQPVYDHLNHDFKVDKENICLINNGVDIERFQRIDPQQRDACRKELNPEERPLIGSIARLSDVKGLDILIRAMREVIEVIPKVKLLIIGQGPMEAELKDLVKNLNLNEYVDFQPAVKETPRILSILDVFVMPSREEGLGLSIIEAQAAGVPVVASNVGGIPSLVKDGETGILVKPENPDDLADGLIKMLNNRSSAAAMSVSAETFVKEHYTADQMGAAVERLYQSVINKI